MRCAVSSILCALMLPASAAAANTFPAFKGDVTAFEACFIQLMIDNRDNPALGLIGPVICGERYIPMGQTCDALGYMLFDRRAGCKADDLVFWQTQVDRRVADLIAQGRSGVSTQREQGLIGCEEVAADGIDPIDCLIEINWRTTMEILAADLVAELTGATE